MQDKPYFIQHEKFEFKQAPYGANNFMPPEPGTTFTPVNDT